MPEFDLKRILEPSGNLEIHFLYFLVVETHPMWLKLLKPHCGRDTRL